MDYEKLKEVIAKQIKENGRGEITGPVLQAVLMAMVDSLGEVYPQTYTEEQKAQARANIDALSNYDGEITKEKLSAEVQAILDDVPNKQNITDESLATIAKTIVGAINEVYKGGLEDGSIATSKIEDGAVTIDKIADEAVTEDKLASQSVSSKKIKDATIGASKLAQAVQDTLGMVGMNVKVLPKGTDLLSDNIEEGVYTLLLGSGEYENFPYTAGINVGAPMVLIKSTTSSMLFGFDNNSSDEFPIFLIKRKGQSWYGNSIAKKFFNKLDNTSTLTDTEINKIWDNN